MPDPFDVRVLCASVGEGRGRPIRLLPMTGGHGVYGLCVATGSADVIFYERATTPPHQEHIILHELSHLLCDHYPASVSAGEQARLLPDLDPEMVKRLLGRTGYSAVEEQEAELLATLILQKAKRPSQPPRPGDDDDGGHARALNDRLEAVLDWARTEQPTSAPRPR